MASERPIGFDDCPDYPCGDFTIDPVFWDEVLDAQTTIFRSQAGRSRRTSHKAPRRKKDEGPPRQNEREEIQKPTIGG